MIHLGNSQKSGGFTDQEWSWLNDALARANQVIASPEFASAILRFNEPSGFTSTTDSRPTILKALSAKDIAINVYIQSYSWWNVRRRKEVAREADGCVIFNRKFFDFEGLPARVNTLVHESAHEIGYQHASATDYLSVPYGSGNVAEKLA